MATHQELLASTGRYEELYRTQFEQDPDVVAAATAT